MTRKYYEKTFYPEDAEYWIANNLIHNRKLHHDVVEKYGKEMLGGRWKMSGEPIIISKTKKVLNGQHRLYACWYYKVPFTSSVVEGVDDETFDVMDSGIIRTAGDLLSIAGFREDPLRVAAAARVVLNYRAGNMRPSAKDAPSKRDVLEFVKENPELIGWVEDTKGKGWTNSYRTSLAVLGFLASHRYPQKVREFVAGFHSGEGLPSGSPILALRNRLGTEKHMHRVDRFALIVMAWNNFAKNKSLVKVQLPRVDANYTFPTIEGAEKQSALKLAA